LGASAEILEIREKVSLGHAVRYIESSCGVDAVKPIPAGLVQIKELGDTPQLSAARPIADGVEQVAIRLQRFQVADDPRHSIAQTLVDLDKVSAFVAEDRSVRTEKEKQCAGSQERFSIGSESRRQERNQVA